MPALLADENFEDEVVDALAALGHDVITARSAGLGRTADPAILARASLVGRIILTHDQDYIRLHNSGIPHEGIVLASFDPDFAALADRIHAFLIANPDLKGQLVRVNRPSKK